MLGHIKYKKKKKYREHLECVIVLIEIHVPMNMHTRGSCI